jgi:hypothetical protein
MRFFVILNNFLKLSLDTECRVRGSKIGYVGFGICEKIFKKNLILVLTNWGQLWYNFGSLAAANSPKIFVDL